MFLFRIATYSIAAVIVMMMAMMMLLVMIMIMIGMVRIAIIAIVTLITISSKIATIFIANFTLSSSLQLVQRFLSNAPAHAQQAVMQSFAPNRQDKGHR